MNKQTFAEKKIISVLCGGHNMGTRDCVLVEEQTVDLVDPSVLS